jgi:hypothetical protein
MYLLVSLASLAGASYLIYTLICDEGQEEAAMTGLEPVEQEALSPRGEQMRQLLVATRAHLWNRVQDWLRRQESSLKLSSRNCSSPRQFSCVISYKVG